MTTHTTASPDLPPGLPDLLLGSTEDVLGAVPYLLGFHPAESLVVIGLRGSPPKGRVHLTVRWDLPLADHDLSRILPLLRKEEITQVIVVGYGSGPLVTPAADAAVALFREGGIRLLDALRVEDGRYWSYVCSRTDCCPPSGAPYDREAGAVAVRAVAHGLVALPDRETLERSLAPVGGAARTAMRGVTGRVAEELRRRIAGCEDPDGLAAGIVADGTARVRAAIGVYAAGGRLDDEQAARLGFDLAVIRIRDEAWALITDDAHDAHRRLWQDLTRRLEPRFVPPAASLLAMAAWRDGDSALASVALARAHEADPGYSMANLLMDALRCLLPPHALKDRMPSPEELDLQMGVPRTSWLLPLVVLLEEPPAGPAGPAG
ncbi:hypothetical protein Ppa06_18690 [Planomonospora parontospora subsp. parontospora]|uniref:DUF4192 domain-containing protein n=2 Tax=Planomonospora parontospora TaxID=58119 RepID=A0AA37BG80_9ACTN|nr:DUF4192 domain-containing protein [Planomonospora parontospora]GGK64540.1 hypothetical protein GCM10010126_24900 [Planomonospora parontospora]GII08071.1 hypothetical protein Ppa06_18690 [Planomonospora parontospora subsp. parontospora]